MLRDVEDHLKDVVSPALKALSSGVSCMLDVPLNRMKKMNWATIADVGDQSGACRVCTHELHVPRRQNVNNYCLPCPGVSFVVPMW